jgi:glutamate racemase
MQRTDETDASPFSSPALIGVLDSGVGGLSILREIHRALPAHPTLYYADQAHLPYGIRPRTEIFSFTQAITHWMLERGASMIVLACNAASAGSLYELRETFPNIPFVGIEPAVKPAAEATRTGVIGVLTTQTTADGDLFKRTVAKYAASVRVITQVAGELVHLVERGDWDTPDGRAMLKRNVAPILEGGADQIALACTHFPFLKPSLAALAGEGVTLVDPSLPVARQVERVLVREGILASVDRHPEHTYVTSGSAERLRVMLHQLIGVDSYVEHIDLDM